MNSITSRRLLLLGALPLPWFLIFVTLGGLLTPGYHMASQHASELLAAGGMSALAFRIGVIGSGLAFGGFGIAVWALSHRSISIAAITWILFGASMLSNGVWPMGNPMHGLYALGLVNLLAPALTHLELTELNGRLVVTTSLVSLCGVLYFWLVFTGLDSPAYRGITQRVFFSIFAAWPLIISRALAFQQTQRLTNR